VADLTAHFGAVGAVSHVKMLFFGDGRSKGCAIVTFEDASAAQRAIATLHNSTIDGRVVYVREVGFVLYL
jgi:RNA recognition motif-containing protein